jgi:hypothetical protein
MAQINLHIESYSKALAEKLCSDFYQSSDAITGEQILKLTRMEQVNLFVIKNLFQKWKEEAQKLKSPYFNYDKEEVKEALNSFLTVLSRNISVRKEFFKPILEKAITDSLQLILNPDLFLEKEFKLKSSYSISELKELKKYFRAGRENFDTIVSALESEGKPLVSSDEIIHIMVQRFRENPLPDEQKQKIISDFSSLLPFETQASEKELIVQKETIVKEREETLTSEIKTLNEKFAGSQLTLNDILKTSVNNVSLAEKIGKARVQNIREVISLNQKFMFITGLFNGDTTEYENALNHVERSNNYEEAFQYLEETYAGRYRWENGKPELLELKEIIYRKFS